MNGVNDDMVGLFSLQGVLRTVKKFREVHENQNQEDC